MYGSLHEHNQRIIAREDHLDPDRHLPMDDGDDDEGTPEPCKLPRNLRRRMARLNDACIDLMHKAPKKFPAPTLTEVFEHAPEGDFTWDDAEASDWDCSWCDDHETYHLCAHGINMGRENGKRWVEYYTVDAEGQWDMTDCYDERTGSTPRYWRSFAEWYMSSRDLWSHFLGWANYYEWCAREQNEPLDQLYHKPTDIVALVTRCVDASWDMVKSCRSLLRHFKRERKRKGRAR